jgi:archaellum component FlaF (FlaF/FlaG flagellin family)
MTTKHRNLWSVWSAKFSTLRIAFVLALLLFVSLPPRAVYADSSGLALEFDGVNDYVRLVRTNTLMGGTTWTSSKTISVWVKPTGTTSPAVAPETGQIIVGNDFPRSFGLTRATSGGNDRLWAWNWDSNGVDRLAIDFPPNQWVHIALVHTDGTLTVYKNGALYGSVVSGNTIVSGSNGDGTLFIGGSGRSGTTTYFAGQVDDVRFWNTGLAQSAIADWMELNLTDSHPNWAQLAADYRMSNGSGTTLTDDSVHDHNGTLFGGMGNANWVISTAYGPPQEPNDPPVADAQSINLDEDSFANIVLTGSDPNNHPLTFRVETQPAHGTLSGTPPNLLYTPIANYHGADSFGFVANDGYVDSALALVSISVTSINDQPVAENDTASTLENTPVTIAVLENDSDVDNDPLSISNTGAAANGTVIHNGTVITYTPNVDYVGTETFTYTISDGNGGEASAQVSVTVIDEDVPPTISAGYALKFDGQSDYVRLARTVDILGSGWESTHSVNLWVKPTIDVTPAASDPAWCDAIFGDRPRWWGISQCVISGYDRIWIWNYDGNYDLIGVPYTRHEWVNIALVQGGGQLSAYRNGVLMGSIASGPTMQPSQSGALPFLQFGAIINNATRNWSFQGEIDEVRLWNIALTATQIQNTMYNFLNGDEPGLAAYYSMSDGSGLIVTDDSVNNWNGTIHDGLSPSVPPDGPAQWVESGAFDQPAASAIVAEELSPDGTVFLTIEGLPESEIDDVPLQSKLFLPAAGND